DALPLARVGPRLLIPTGRQRLAGGCGAASARSAAEEGARSHRTPGALVVCTRLRPSATNLAIGRTGRSDCSGAVAASVLGLRRLVEPDRGEGRQALGQLVVAVEDDGQTVVG